MLTAKVTQREKEKAKRDGLKVWSYLYNNPEQEKEDMPKNLYNLVKDCRNECPLCSLYRDNYGANCNHECPLVINRKTCYHEDHVFQKYINYSPYMYYGFDKAKRIKYAKKIYDRIEKWDTGEGSKK